MNRMWVLATGRHLVGADQFLDADSCLVANQCLGAVLTDGDYLFTF